jgi:hypothetical protein
MNMLTKKVKDKKEVKEAVATPEDEKTEEHDTDAKVDPEVEAIEKIIPSKKKPAAPVKHIDDPEEWARIEEERDTWD